MDDREADKLRRSFAKKKQGEFKRTDMTECMVVFQPL